MPRGWMFIHLTLSNTFFPTMVCGPTGQQEYYYQLVFHHFLVWKSTETIRQLLEDDDRLLIRVPARDTFNDLASDFLSLLLQQLLITKSAAMLTLVVSLPKRQKMSCSRLSKAGAAFAITSPFCSSWIAIWELKARDTLLLRWQFLSDVNIEACQ